MPADLGWRLGAGFKRLCLQTIKNHINLNCQRRNGFQKLLTASTAPPQPCAGKAQRQTQSHQPTGCGVGWDANPAASAASLCWCDCKPKYSMASDTFFERKCNGEKKGETTKGEVAAGQCIPPYRPNCGNQGFRQSVPLNLCVASSFPTKGSRFKDEKERQSSDDRRVLSLKYPVFLSCCFTSPQPSSKRTQASGASISTGQNQPQKAPLHARLQHYLMLMLMNK